MIRCVVFDFDGTLVDSNHIKRDCFFAVVDAIPDGRDIMDRILSFPGCGDRHAVFEKFARMAGLPAGSNESLTRQYSTRCRILIDGCPNMPGAEPAMETLCAQQSHLFINSATPEAELQPIVQARSFCRFLDGVFGGPATKAENLQQILTMLSVLPRELLVVGDGVDDHAAAEEAGCPFVPVFAYPGGALRRTAILNDLTALPSVVLELNSGVDA